MTVNVHPDVPRRCQCSAICGRRLRRRRFVLTLPAFRVTIPLSSSLLAVHLDTLLSRAAPTPHLSKGTGTFCSEDSAK